VRLLAAVPLIGLTTSALAHGEVGTAPRGAEPSLVHGPTVHLDAKHRLTLLPGSQLYPRYLANPREPMMKALTVHVIHSDTPQTGSFLYEFTVGGNYGLVRLHSEREPERGLQLNAHAGVLNQFDPTESLDGIGWDGYFGLSATLRAFDELAAKLAYQHDSAHLDDEYIEKTGRRRINYTREEVVLGMMVDPSEHARVYTEVGYAFHLGNDELKPWRTESGLELRFHRLYAAVDLTFWEELNFRPTTTVQLGLLYERKGTGRRYGVFGQYEHGRSKLGEFYRDQTETIGCGWWLDF